MPELKRNFTKGRMNKDLDERMVPNGEYRDALNVEISTSEGSNVGTVQTLMGNTNISEKFGNKATCVGVIGSERDNKVYWFVSDPDKNTEASTTKTHTSEGGESGDGLDKSIVHDVYSDYIMEYDEFKKQISYVVVENYKVETTISNNSHGGGHLHVSNLGTGGDIRPVGIQVGMDVYINNIPKTSIIKIEEDDSGTWEGWRIYTKHTSSDVGYSALANITAGDSIKFELPNDKRVLGFSHFASEKPGDVITGINIIDDLLFWTDGISEPKKINIKRCIYGSQQLAENRSYLPSAANNNTSGTRTFPTLLVVNGQSPSSGNGRLGSITTYPSAIRYPFLSYHHATVIKKSPTEPLKLIMSNSTRPDMEPVDGQVIIDSHVNLGVQPTYPTSDFFFDGNGGKLEYGATTISLTFPQLMDWESGDIIEWYAVDDEAGFEQDILATTSVLTNVNNITFTFTILSISKVLIKPFRDFKVKLRRKDPLFQFKFPRFAYRWKYEDGEYSCYSPFSEVAFLPEEFDYLPKKGYNLGMTNNLRYLLLHGFKPKTTPLDVVEIDVLYKESNSPNVYTVDTIKSPSVQNLYLGTNQLLNLDANGWFGEVKYKDNYIESPNTLDSDVYLVSDSFLDGTHDIANGVYYYTLTEHFSVINIKIGDVIILGTNTGLTGSLKIAGMQNVFITNSAGVDVLVTRISITNDLIAVDDTNSSWLFTNNTVTFKRDIPVKPAVYLDDPQGSLEIKTDMIHATLPSNQLLRPYDNVPRTALAQEITGNRVVYGNYLQNYDLMDGSGVLTTKFQSSIQQRSNRRENVQYDDRTALRNPSTGASIVWWDLLNTIPRNLKKPERSLKSIRDYQVGVVYMDEFGRQTPIQTHDTGIQRIPKYFANDYNALRIKLGDPDPTDPILSTQRFPDWATHFKFYIKENSNEYYNLAMDRFYDAEDGNIWLSFPSSERNKVDEDTFLILKKEHDTDEFVKDKARYKILAIENEAPMFVKTKKDSHGVVATAFGSSGLPKYQQQHVDVPNSHLFILVRLEVLLMRF